MQLPRTDTALLRNPDREVEQAGADREAINTGERKKKYKTMMLRVGRSVGCIGRNRFPSYVIGTAINN